jgi:hypothetical protein
MIMSSRSPARNADHVYHAARLTMRQLAQISLLVQQMTARSLLLCPRNGQRKSAGMLRPAQSLHLSPRAGMHAERSPLKSP